MRACLELKPINNIIKIDDTIYDLSFIQEPKYARESTILKNHPSTAPGANPVTFTTSPANIHKRLLHPFPILGLKLYHEDKEKGKLDITGHNLSFFMLKSTIIKCTKTFKNNINTNTHPHRRLDDDEDDEEESKEKLIDHEDIEQIVYKTDLIPNNDEVIVGTRWISGSFYNLPRDQVQIIDRSETIIVFMFTDIGFLKKGNYRMLFELYKYEPFNYFTKEEDKKKIVNNDLIKLKKIVKISNLVSKNIKVYGPREYYNTSVQNLINKNMKFESENIHKDRLRSKVINYLKAINIIKDYEKQANKNELKNLENINNNKKLTAINNKKVKKMEKGSTFTFSIKRKNSLTIDNESDKKPKLSSSSSSSSLINETKNPQKITLPSIDTLINSSELPPVTQLNYLNLPPIQSQNLRFDMNHPASILTRLAENKIKKEDEEDVASTLMRLKNSKK